MKKLIPELMGFSILALAAASVPAVAAFPEKPITIIVPFSAGGPADVMARIIGEHMARTLAQPIIVENVTGAGGTTGATRAAQSKADGYTISMGHMGTHGAAPAQYPNLKYHPERDFAPIGLVAGTPILIVARKNFPAESLKEFIDYLRKHQDKVNEAHAGVGSVSHSACSLLQSLIGTKVARVGYSGTGPAINDLVGGHVDFACDQIVNVAPHILAGTIKAYAIATPSRSPLVNAVPTTNEAGLPGYEVSAWQALFAPAQTSPEVIGKLNAALSAALDDPGTRQRLSELGSIIPDKAGRSPEALRKLVESEVARWAKVFSTVR